jgi:adenine-specific DNA-methyltransferase
MAKKVESIKHTGSTRPSIPSKEEAGYEEANAKVQDGKKVLELPKNPVVHRGQDPELFWLNKYGNDDRDDLLRVDIRSLYRHEHIAPETLIKNLYKTIEVEKQPDLFSSVNELFGNALEKDELEKVSEYYHHQDGWTNRLIQGDSHLVMASLLEREGMAGQVQTIYIDPPYGIKYGGNWQIKLNNRDVKDGNDEALTGEPEQIKAFRDTWELGIHSYLSYLRDRLLIAKELLTESGSCFVQISDENVHLVRNLMDEVFGSENFIRLISFQKTSGQESKTLASTVDFIVWYAKNADVVKYRQLYEFRTAGEKSLDRYDMLMLKDGTTRRLSKEEMITGILPDKARRYQLSALYSEGSSSTNQVFEFDGTIYEPRKGTHWKTTVEGLKKLAFKKRLEKMGTVIRYRRFADDFPVIPYTDRWQSVMLGTEKRYIVQTSEEVIKRCILMTTDPGDLILDPTCGSGTTAFVAEQWGRRWITIDTSRIALNIAKQRLMTAVFPYYNLYDEQGSDIRQGFKYKTIPHITLKSLANDEPPATETLYDQPETDKNKLRVSGPFTVETLQNYEPISPAELETENLKLATSEAFEEVIKQHLLSAGIKNGRKDEMVVFRSVELLSHSYLHAEGFYNQVFSSQFSVSSEETKNSKPETQNYQEAKAYFHIGPKFGTVSKTAVNEAVKECRQRGDAGWLIILGFSFESDIEGSTQTMSMGKFEVTKVRIHDDLLQEGLKKKPAKSAASFVTIGEPDIEVVSDEWLVNSKGEIICNYGILKKLSGLDSLAKISGLSETDIRAYCLFSQRRDVWLNLTNEKSSSFNFSEYSRRAGEKFGWGVSTVLGNSERFFSGVRDFDYFISELGFSNFGSSSAIIESFSRDKQNAQRLTEIPEVNKLATHHYSLITIKGLDIYDPIKDEVKARNVHDIAYWMVDDDYDGSNFVVKQVFFCGGDKSEFDKWKKGLDNLAKDSTKKKVEKTLKIEIDEEAFDRLYGHVSQPIEIKKKGQKLAVRIISQFGEECTKVFTI